MRNSKRTRNTGISQSYRMKNTPQSSTSFAQEMFTRFPQAVQDIILGDILKSASRPQWEIERDRAIQAEREAMIKIYNQKIDRIIVGLCGNRDNYYDCDDADLEDLMDYVRDFLDADQGFERNPCITALNDALTAYYDTLEGSSEELMALDIVRLTAAMVLS